MKVRRRGRSSPSSPPAAGWKPGELDLRTREVAAAEGNAKSQKWSQIAQVLSVAAALATALAAFFAAQQSRSAAQVSARQTAEGQLTSAISSLDVGNSSQRIIQMLLISRDIEGILAMPFSTSEEQQDAFTDYTITLQAFTVYLNSYNPASTPSFGRGYGAPARFSVPLDVFYAADQLELLLDQSMEGRVTALNSVARPAIDLANDELAGQDWHGVNFGWILAYLTGIDLRGANLGSSRWSAESDLSHSYLQCADLEGADFRGADLSFADLRGANVQGADFRGAHIEGARLTSLYGHADWPQGVQGVTTLPVEEWNPVSCLRNVGFWDNQPTSAPSPVSLSSSSAP